MMEGKKFEIGNAVIIKKPNNPDLHRQNNKLSSFFWSDDMDKYNGKYAVIREREVWITDDEDYEDYFLSVVEDNKLVNVSFGFSHLWLEKVKPNDKKYSQIVALVI